MKVLSNIYRDNILSINFRYCMSILMSVLKLIDEVIEAAVTFLRFRVILGRFSDSPILS